MKHNFWISLLVVPLFVASAYGDSAPTMSARMREMTSTVEQQLMADRELLSSLQTQMDAYNRIVSPDEDDSIQLSSQKLIEALRTSIQMRQVQLQLLAAAFQSPEVMAELHQLAEALHESDSHFLRALDQWRPPDYFIQIEKLAELDELITILFTQAQAIAASGATQWPRDAGWKVPRPAAIGDLLAIVMAPSEGSAQVEKALDALVVAAGRLQGPQSSSELLNPIKAEFARALEPINPTLVDTYEAVLPELRQSFDSQFKFIEKVELLASDSIYGLSPIEALLRTFHLQSLTVVGTDWLVIQATHKGHSAQTCTVFGLF